MKALFFAIFYFIIIGSSQCQTKDIKSNLKLIENARDLSDSNKFIEAIPAWKKIIESNYVNSEFWSKLGDAYYGTGLWKEAIDPYKKAIELGFEMPWEWSLPIAECYAKLNLEDSCYFWLKKTLDLKYPSLEGIKEDTILKKYFKDKKFSELLWMRDPSKMNRNDGWNYDLSYLWWQIQRVGLNPYRKFSKEKFLAFYSKIKNEIPSSTDYKLTTEFMKMVAMVADGHSGVRVTSLNNPQVNKKLPFKFKFFKEGLFIISTDNMNLQYLGSKVMAIDGIKIAEIEKKLTNYIGHESPIWVNFMAQYVLPFPALLAGMDISKHPGNYTMSLIDLKGKILDVNFKSIDLKKANPNNSSSFWKSINTLGQKIPLAGKNQGPYWFEYIPEKEALYFSFSEVTNKPDESFQDFNKRMFNYIDSHRVNKMIIDLRENTGGNTALLYSFIQSILKYDKINQKNKLFCLIGKTTFSAGQNFVNYLETFTHVTFVGEPTGSSPNFIGEVNNFILPYTKIKANISNIEWQTSFPQDNRIWTAPEIFIEPTFKDFIEGYDTPLQSILEMGK